MPKVITKTGSSMQQSHNNSWLQKWSKIVKNGQHMVKNGERGEGVEGIKGVEGGEGGRDCQIC